MRRQTLETIKAISITRPCRPALQAAAKAQVTGWTPRTTIVVPTAVVSNPRPRRITQAVKTARGGCTRALSMWSDTRRPGSMGSTSRTSHLSTPYPRTQDIYPCWTDQYCQMGRNSHRLLPCKSSLSRTRSIQRRVHMRRTCRCHRSGSSSSTRSKRPRFCRSTTAYRTSLPLTINNNNSSSNYRIQPVRKSTRAAENLPCRRWGLLKEGDNSR